MARRKIKRGSSKSKFIILAIVGIICLTGISILVGSILLKKKDEQVKPEELLKAYMNHISKEEYKEMYQMITLEGNDHIDEETFITRHTKIYQGMEMQNLKIENIQVEKEVEKEKDDIITVFYETTFDTTAGHIQFENEAEFVKNEAGYALIWKDSLIHPDLTSTDKVGVSTSQAKRGTIVDRNGTLLAGEGVASSVGIVPGKLVDNETSFAQIAALLEIDAATISKKLEAGWVKADSFVPIKTIPKVKELDLMGVEVTEEVSKEQERQAQLLAIPGVMISDETVREYPLKNAAAHLVGYVQSVTAEDLEKHVGEGYTANSVIGRNGMEGLYEKELKGQNGCEIYISDKDGNKKAVLANLPKEDGKEIKLTIDANVQKLLYEQFQTDKSATVAMHPYTGEVLALISTPSYNNNDFIMGMSTEKWTALNEDVNQPMYNRFRQTWSPGSTLKPIIGAIGLQTGALDPTEDFGNVGLSWQKDASWGSYFVTTLHEYAPVILENALIYSDNIYFAKVALKIGAEQLASSLEKIGFKQEVPFEIKLKESQYSNAETIESEVQLADSGYGQGQILVNPVHLASMYTAFLNEGSLIKPYLLYSPEAKKEVWISEAFSSDVTNQVLEGMKKVVNDPNGTGYAIHRGDITLAGKTGTAEIKASKEDQTGTELGWFSVFTTDPQIENPILIVSMVEDVKEIGGSGYVVRKVKNVLDIYLQGAQ